MAVRVQMLSTAGTRETPGHNSGLAFLLYCLRTWTVNSVTFWIFLGVSAIIACVTAFGLISYKFSQI